MIGFRFIGDIPSTAVRLINSRMKKRESIKIIKMLQIITGHKTDIVIIFKLYIKFYFPNQKFD